MKQNTFAKILLTGVLCLWQFGPGVYAGVNNNTAKITRSVTLEGVMTHLMAFQEIADANGGTRISGSDGYNASAEYVAGLMREAGYEVTVQPFEFGTFFSITPSLLRQVAPGATRDLAHRILTYSGSGDVTAPVYHVAGDGCGAADYAGFPAGAIALIRRGTDPGESVACTFELKATTAYAAGAAGVIIYNNVEGEINGTLGATFALDLPVVAVTGALGAELAVTPGLVVQLKTDTFRGTATSYNVVAESRGGDPDNVVMVGAHLDSVNVGPGIQDNGSGSAAILETALQMAKVKPRNKVRFAWWGAQESAMLGSQFYINSLTAGELGRVALYINVDTIASPNYVFFVYDGDDSDGEGFGPGPEGSGRVEEAFQAFYQAAGQPYKAMDLVPFADHLPFAGAGIPVGGIQTGSFGVKTAEEAAIWGGTAGIPYDPCYHQACDTIDNLSLFALDINADAVASVVLQFAMNTEAVNGQSGKGNFK